MTQEAISHRLKSLRMIQKQEKWVPYELTLRNVECRFFTCKILLARHKRKGFMHRILTGDEKWIPYDNPKKEGIMGTTSLGDPVERTVREYSDRSLKVL